MKVYRKLPHRRHAYSAKLYLFRISTPIEARALFLSLKLTRVAIHSFPNNGRANSFLMSERQRQVSGLTRKLVAEGIIEEASALKIDQEAKSANLPFVTYSTKKASPLRELPPPRLMNARHTSSTSTPSLGSSDPTSSPSSRLF